MITIWVHLCLPAQRDWCHQLCAVSASPYCWVNVGVLAPNTEAKAQDFSSSHCLRNKSYIVNAISTCATLVSQKIA